jgi:hypothetical protein
MGWIALVAAVMFSFIAQGSWANVVLFQRVTDTIQLSSPTSLGTAATLEARILHTPAYSGGNVLYREWVDSVTDKNLAVTPSSIAVELHDVAPTLSVPAAINPNAWHHIAAVYDGASLSLYLDGVRIAAASASGSIANGNSRPIFGGGKYESYWPIAGFIGYVDWFRMSNVARYGGATFAPPTSQPASDSNTVLLFYFDEAPGSTNATDQSSYRNNGTLGAGVSGATQPVFTSDPLAYPSPPPEAAAVPTLADTMLMCLAASLGVAGGLLVRRRLRRTSA